MIINQLYRSNDNIGIIAEMLHRGIISGDFKLSDEVFRCTLLALTNNVIKVNDDIHDATKKSSSPCCSLVPCNASVQCQDFVSDSSLLSNSVHILDVTDDNSDQAQELSSHRRVSRIGEIVNNTVIVENPVSKKRALPNDLLLDYAAVPNDKNKSVRTVEADSKAILVNISDVLSYLSHRNNDVSAFIKKYKDVGEYRN
jgi:hypothetical protein